MSFWEPSVAQYNLHHAQVDFFRRENPELRPYPRPSQCVVVELTNGWRGLYIGASGFTTSADTYVVSLSYRTWLRMGIHPYTFAKSEVKSIWFGPLEELPGHRDRNTYSSTSFRGLPGSDN